MAALRFPGELSKGKEFTDLVLQKMVDDAINEGGDYWKLVQSAQNPTETFTGWVIASVQLALRTLKVQYKREQVDEAVRRAGGATSLGKAFLDQLASESLRPQDAGVAAEVEKVLSLEGAGVGGFGN